MWDSDSWLSRPVLAGLKENSQEWLSHNGLMVLM